MRNPLRFAIYFKKDLLSTPLIPSGFPRMTTVPRIPCSGSLGKKSPQSSGLERTRSIKYCLTNLLPESIASWQLRELLKD